MPRPISYAVFCLKKKIVSVTAIGKTREAAARCRGHGETCTCDQVSPISHHDHQENLRPRGGNPGLRGNCDCQRWIRIHGNSRPCNSVKVARCVRNNLHYITKDRGYCRRSKVGNIGPGNSHHWLAECSAG